MKKIFFSLVTIVMASIMGVTATQAYFSDVETSVGNTFSAGNLDLIIDGDNINVVKFNLQNMSPGNQPNSGWLLQNIGSIKGYLDLEEITVVGSENNRIEPEIEAGDISDGVGELQDVLNVRLFLDYDKDGWIDAGETVFFNGKVGTLPSNFPLDVPLNAGADIRIAAIFDWWTTPDDNKAMTDSIDLSIKFELGQTAAQ